VFYAIRRLTRCHLCIQVFKEEEESIKVDLHEGCGRTKLFWLMALTDSKTLKSLVEFRDGGKKLGGGGGAGGGAGAGAACRFCGSTAITGLTAAGNVCGDAECQVCEAGREVSLLVD
jgi:E3 ubiquitin-protein ligase MYCBP2